MDITKQFNLPNYTKGKSFAEATVLINKKIRDEATRNEMLDRVRKAQEYLKSQMQPEQPQESDQSMMPQQMGIPGQQMAPGQPSEEETMMQQQQAIPQQQMGYGGSTNKYFGGGSMFSQFMPAVGQTGITTPTASQLGNNAGQMLKGSTPATPSVNPSETGLNLPGGIGEIANKAGEVASLFSKKNDNVTADSAEVDPTKSSLSKAASWGTTGATIGGPVGAAVGALGGGIVGALGANKTNKAIRGKKVEEQVARVNAEHDVGPNNRHALGGLMDPPANKGLVSDQQLDREADLQRVRANKLNLAKHNDILNNASMIGSPSTNLTLPGQTAKGPDVTAPSKFSNALSNTREFLSDNKDKIGKYSNDLLRYAPAIGNLLTKKEKPDVERLDRINTRVRAGQYDLNEDINALRNQRGNANRSLSEMSGGNLSANRANILASNLQSGMQESRVRAAATEKQRQMDNRAEDANLRIDTANVGISNQEKDINARNKGAAATANRNRRNAILENIGAIGKENFQDKALNKMLGYDKYGNKITANDSEATNSTGDDSKSKPGSFSNKLDFLNASKVGDFEFKSRYNVANTEDVDPEDVDPEDVDPEVTSKSGGSKSANYTSQPTRAGMTTNKEGNYTSQPTRAGMTTNKSGNQSGNQRDANKGNDYISQPDRKSMTEKVIKNPLNTITPGEGVSNNPTTKDANNKFNFSNNESPTPNSKQKGYEFSESSVPNLTIGNPMDWEDDPDSPDTTSATGKIKAELDANAYKNPKHPAYHSPENQKKRRIEKYNKSILSKNKKK